MINHFCSKYDIITTLKKVESDCVALDNKAMPEKNNSYKLPVISAIVLHAILFVALFLHFIPKLKLGPGPEAKIINAAIVDQHSMAALPNRAEAIAKQQKLAQQKQQQEKQQMEKARQQQLAQEKLQQQLAAQKALAEQQAAQKQAEEKAQQQLAAQQATEKAHQAALLKQQQAAALAAKKKALAQKQLKQKLAQAQQQMLQQQIAQEQQQLSATAAASAHNQEMQNEIDKYKALILQTIGQNWLVPDNTDKSLSCQLLIQVAPGGEVLGVQVIKSSGNPALDSSATAAVFKSSPLPVPTDPELFDKFRQLRLTVKPENVTS